jgi:hypothetical protein
MAEFVIQRFTGIGDIGYLYFGVSHVRLHVPLIVRPNRYQLTRKETVRWMHSRTFVFFFSFPFLFISSWPIQSLTSFVLLVTIYKCHVKVVCGVASSSAANRMFQPLNSTRSVGILLNIQREPGCTINPMEMWWP